MNQRHMDFPCPGMANNRSDLGENESSMKRLHTEVAWLWSSPSSVQSEHWSLQWRHRSARGRIGWALLIVWRLSGLPREEFIYARSASANISEGFCCTSAPVLPKTTLPHLNSLFIPRSHKTSTDLVSSMTRIRDTSNTPALTRILILAILGRASRSDLILSCLLALLAAAMV